MSEAVTKTVKNVPLGQNKTLVDLPLARPAGAVGDLAAVVSARAVQRGDFGIGHACDVVVVADGDDGEVLARTRLATTPTCDLLPLYAYRVDGRRFRVRLVGTGDGVASAELTVLWPVRAASVDLSGTSIGQALDKLDTTLSRQPAGSARPAPAPYELEPLAADNKPWCPVAPGQTNIVPIYRRGNRILNTGASLPANTADGRVTRL